MGEYVVKEKNIKNIIAYILMGVVVVFYEYYMFNHYPVVAYITSGITLISLSIYLLEYISKEGLFITNLINYVVVPIIYWLCRFIYHLCEGKTVTDIIAGFAVVVIGLLIFAWIIWLFFDD